MEMETLEFSEWSASSLSWPGTVERRYVLVTMHRNDPSRFVAYAVGVERTGSELRSQIHFALTGSFAMELDMLCARMMELGGMPVVFPAMPRFRVNTVDPTEQPPTMPPGGEVGVIVASLDQCLWNGDQQPSLLQDEPLPKAA